MPVTRPPRLRGKPRVVLVREAEHVEDRVAYLKRFRDTYPDLADDDVMSRAWR